MYRTIVITAEGHEARQASSRPRAALFMVIGVFQGADEFMDMLKIIPMFALCVAGAGFLARA